MAFIQSNATAVWPPSGIALAGLLVFGLRLWPAVFIGAFLVNITTTATPLAANQMLPVGVSVPSVSTLPLAWTEAVTLVAEDHVPDEVHEAVRPHFSEKELCDLTLAVATINAWNRLAIASRMVPGAYKAPQRKDLKTGT